MTPSNDGDFISYCVLCSSLQELLLVKSWSAMDAAANCDCTCASRVLGGARIRMFACPTKSASPQCHNMAQDVAITSTTPLCSAWCPGVSFPCANDVTFRFSFC